MFGLFKRTKIEQWEIDTMANCIKELGAQYNVYYEQIMNGLLRSVRLGEDDSINFVAFTFDPNLSRRYIDEREEYKILSGIRVFDLLSNQYIDLEIHMANSLIFGYATPFNTKVKLDPQKIDVSGVHLLLQTNADFEEVRTLLTEIEIKAINVVDVQKERIAGLTIYKIKNLEDGDFIAIDLQKRVYKVTHDPYKIEQIANNLQSYLALNG